MILRNLLLSNFIDFSPSKCLYVRDGVSPFARPGKVVTICEAYLQNTIKTLGPIEISWKDAKYERNRYSLEYMRTFFGVRNVLGCVFKIEG